MKITQAILQLFEWNQPQNFYVAKNDDNDDEIANAIPGCETK